MIEIVYEAEKEKCNELGITKEQFLEFYKDWDIKEWPGCIVISNGKNFHVVATKSGKWANKKLFKEIFGKAIKEHGYAETVAYTEEDKKFAERLGFEKVDERNGVSFYEMYEVKYERSRKHNR